MKKLKCIFSILLLIFGCTAPSHAEELSWEELNAKVTGHYQQQQFTTAAGYGQEALDLARKSGTKEELAISLNSLALISNHLQRYPEAEGYGKESIAVRQNLFGPDDPMVAIAWQSLGLTYFLGRQMDDAELCFQEVLRIQTETHGEKSAEIIPALQQLEKYYRYTEQHDKEKALNTRIQNLQTGPE